MTISDILRDSDYSLDLLEKHIDDLTIFQKEQKSGLTPLYGLQSPQKRDKTYSRRGSETTLSHQTTQRVWLPL